MERGKKGGFETTIGLVFLPSPYMERAAGPPKAGLGVRPNQAYP